MNRSLRVRVSVPGGVLVLAALGVLVLSRVGGAYGLFSDTERASGFLAASADFPPLPATVDIDPDTLNPESEGYFVTAYVELPEPWDVADIDVSTVRLAVQGEAATVSAENHPTELGDHDGDGIADAMVKFHRQAALGLFEGTFGPVTTRVTGQIGNRTFQGTCTVNVLDPPPAMPSPSATPALTSTATATATPALSFSPTATAAPAEASPTEEPTATATVPEDGVTSPTQLTCARLNLFERRMEWLPASHVDRYVLYHDGPFGSDAFDEVAQVDSPATTYDDVSPSFFHHRWYVASMVGTWESGSSHSLEVHCRPTVYFPAPRGLNGSSHDWQRTVRLTWEPVAGAVRYGVFRAAQSGGPYEMVALVERAGYGDNAVSDGVTYYYVVVALDAAGNESDPSDELAVAYVAPTPSPTPTPTAAVTATPSSTPEASATATAPP